MSPTSDPAFAAMQAAVAGRFSLECELGRGGMGIVFLARDVILERPVAMKLLAPVHAARAEMRRRFLREARIAAGCFHPHIVPIHAVEESGDLAWLVMSYVRGETLADRIRRAGALPIDMVRRIGQEIGLALACLHERGVIHRDVKPENILLEDGTDRALITDFGIALHEDVHRTPARGDVVGTIRYMAPEQALGEPLDGRADLYALGVTLFVAATGRYPFGGTADLALLATAGTRVAPRVRAVAPSLPDSLGAAIDRCLAPSASHRFRSAAELVAALTPVHTTAPLPAVLVPVATDMAAARSLAFWAGVVALTGIPFVMGEQTSGWALAETLMTSLVQATCTILALAATLRASEALLRARKALRLGAGLHDVQRSLVAHVADGEGAEARAARSHHTRWLVGKWMGVGLGVGLALVQGEITRNANMPAFVDGAAQLLLLFAPPLLVGRSLGSLWRGSRAERWLTTRVSRPLSVRVAGWLGRGGSNVRAPQPLPASAPTEVRLGEAAHDIVKRLPAHLRDAVSALPAAATALAAEAERLRRRDLVLSEAQAALNGSGTVQETSEFARLEEERAQLRGRLGATIAALEALRLDLLRLEAGDSEPGELTVHLAVVRDLQRHVDAAQDVRRLLARDFTSEPTPV